jgi:hypothetical protein
MTPHARPRAGARYSSDQALQVPSGKAGTPET